MAVFKAYHIYKKVNKRKPSRYIDTIMPVRDMEVSLEMSYEFYDATGENDDSEKSQGGE